MTDSLHFDAVNLQHLRRESLVLVASPGHPLARRKAVCYRDLEEQTLLFAKTD